MAKTSMPEWDAIKAEAAGRLLELIQIRLISASIHVAASLESPICWQTRHPKASSNWPRQQGQARHPFGG